MSGAAAEEKEAFTNIFANALAPIDFRKLSQVGGAAEYVAAEVLVSYFARYLFKIEKRTLLELAAIHAVSIPLLGGLAATFDDNHILGYEAPVTDLIYDSAKGVPAVFAAQYVCNTALAGLHAPKLNFQDILVTAATKIVTRPIVSIIYPYLGETFRNNLDVVEELVSRQRSKSRLLSTSELEKAQGV